LKRISKISNIQIIYIKKWVHCVPNNKVQRSRKSTIRQQLMRRKLVKMTRNPKNLKEIMKKFRMKTKRM